mmetsp:Transcript_3076/g.8513  ORF Transcript_3076/g.8513 Transcript_3076/m.8513 type:complete len:321 (-) Transcript_3076:5134-6096(-)
MTYRLADRLGVVLHQSDNQVEETLDVLLERCLAQLAQAVYYVRDRRNERRKLPHSLLVRLGALIKLDVFERAIHIFHGRRGRYSRALPSRNVLWHRTVARRRRSCKRRRRGRRCSLHQRDHDSLAKSHETRLDLRYGQAVVLEAVETQPKHHVKHRVHPVHFLLEQIWNLVHETRAPERKAQLKVQIELLCKKVRLFHRVHQANDLARRQRRIALRNYRFERKVEQQQLHHTLGPNHLEINVLFLIVCRGVRRALKRLCFISIPPVHCILCLLVRLLVDRGICMRMLCDALCFKSIVQWPLRALRMCAARHSAHRHMPRK